jgi:hypothetical protein
MSRRYGKRRSRNNEILILCQGKTEEIYFKSFPAVQASRDWSIRVVVESFSLDPLQLVEKAITLSRPESGEGDSRFNTIWCVFDKDDFKQNFKAGIKRADSENIRVAFSIESFELWLLLHFTNVPVDSPLNRKGYIKALQQTNRLPGYKKDESWQKENISVRNFRKAQLDKAIEHSKDLERNSKLSKSEYQKQNCTIHRIVEFLNAL